VTGALLRYARNFGALILAAALLAQAARRLGGNR
jgi:hypothetical protein